MEYQKKLQRKQPTHKSRALRGKYQKKVAIYKKELENINKDYQAFAENYDRLYGVFLDPGIYVSNSNPIENHLFKSSLNTEVNINIEKIRTRKNGQYIEDNMKN